MFVENLCERTRKLPRTSSLRTVILSDPAKEVAKAYGLLMAVGVPNRWTYYIGPDGNILAIDKQVSPSTAGADVAARLAELGVARRP